MISFDPKVPVSAHDGDDTPVPSNKPQSIPETPASQAAERQRFYPTPFELRPIPSRKVVLVVEDDLSMLMFLRDSLRRENYELVVTDRPQTALEWVERGLVPDLLITDLVMPQMTGVDLSKKLRAVVPTLPVLFETGHCSRLFQESPELESKTAFIEKPFSPRGLIEAARLALFGTFNPA